jgi:hypothetical protein
MIRASPFLFENGGIKNYPSQVIMNEKKHLMCALCNEPVCLEDDCIFHTYPREITNGVKNLAQGGRRYRKGKTLPASDTTSVTVPPNTKNPAEQRNKLIDFRYLPAYFRRGETARQPMIKHEKRYIVCYLCDEPECLEEECLFLSDPRDITRGMKNYVRFIDIPFKGDHAIDIPHEERRSVKTRETPLDLLYLHAVKIFWFCAVIGAIIYVVVFGGLPFLSSQFFSIESQLPLQVYLSIFGIGVTVVCLAMANLFGTGQETAR